MSRSAVLLLAITLSLMLFCRADEWELRSEEVEEEAGVIETVKDELGALKREGAELEQELAKLEGMRGQILRIREKVADRKRELDEMMRTMDREKKEVAQFEKMVIELAMKYEGIACPEPIEHLWDGVKALQKCLERVKDENADLRGQLERVKKRP